ncbi:hypothetical protein F5Y13DRAFT_143279 [Hypoxylon sp. FL1857]|nr:hypothetical protein F5Y13DRAFT_143279 [Hypoxylon sp. FL1857]
MASHKKKKKHQTRLTFEPVGSSNSSGQASSPAKVRYAKGAVATSSPSRSSPSHQMVHTSAPSKEKQSRLRSSTGRSQTMASPTRPPAASFMPGRHGSRRRPVGSDSSDEEEEDEDKDEDDMPLRSSQSVSTKLRRTIISDDDDDEDGGDDDTPIIPPSTGKRLRPPVITVDDEDEDDDEPIVVPGSSKRRRPEFIELEDSSDGVASPMKKRKTSLVTPGRLKKPAQMASSSPTKRGRPRVHRSEKQKKMELLRRRRAGEMIDKVTSSEEDSDGERRGLYDSDSDQELQVLKEFDDEEPDEEEVEAPARHPSGKRGPSKRREEDELDDFVTDDDDAPIGAPANLDIPLEFTAQAHRPLKHQFPYVIEWLVHNRINPAFERKDPVYVNAWRKLDDEVRTLASSKFASSAWKSEFYRALKGRPKMDFYEMDGSERSSGLYNSCEACGRSSHPATFKIFFRGHPYYKDTLAEVESDSSDSDSDDSGEDESGHESVDSQGMTLPSEKKEWHVGVVCCGNAETAHSLIHWKHALKEWVEDQLEQDGWMDAKKLKERERMKARKRRDLANKITDGWREKNIIPSLYRDFKNNLEEARNKSTTARSRGRYR